MLSERQLLLCHASTLPQLMKMSESQWAMPLAWVDVRLPAEGISRIWIYIYIPDDREDRPCKKTGHFVAVAPLLHGWHCPRLPHFEKQEQVLTFLLRVRAFCPHSSMWFGRTAGHGGAVKHGELCSAWTSKKARRGMLHAKRLKWARRLSRSSQQGLSMLVHVLGYIVFEDIWVLSRTAGPAWTAPVQTTPLQRTVEDGGRHAWNRD